MALQRDFTHALQLRFKFALFRTVQDLLRSLHLSSLPLSLSLLFSVSLCEFAHFGDTRAEVPNAIECFCCRCFC